MRANLLLDLLALTVLLVNQARKASKGRRVTREFLGHKASAVMLVRRVLQVRRVKSALVAKTVLMVAMDATA